MAAPLSPIESIRDSSRRLVRELGFMRDVLAGTGLPPSAVHALLEIEQQEMLTAGQLSDLLTLEKSSVSRMLRKLIEADEIQETPGTADGRTKLLSLTPRGRATVADIHRFARRQVADALDHLSPDQRHTVSDGLKLYADALAANRTAAQGPAPITIEMGYRPGALSRCAEMHARYYARTAGFGRAFEALVASGLAEFSGRLDRPCNGLWLALRGTDIVGTIAIDGEDIGPDIAHLRWFVVDEDAQGYGIGRKLLSAALGFCDARGFSATHLWTFRGLDSARHLYEEQGFVLAEEWLGQQWGSEVMEQRFVRDQSP